MENLIILGTGIAGLTAAIYAARANLSPLLLSGREDGGQLTLTTAVENFPGFPNGVQGPELIAVCKQQAEKFGARFKVDAVTTVKKISKGFELQLESGEKIQAKTIIIATGASARWLGLESEQKYKGRGVTTCATCLPTGSTIVANNAPKAIDKIEEGEQVLTYDGTFQKVVGKGSRPFKGKLVKIIPRYFREEPTLLTPEHPVYAAKMKRGVGANYRDMKWEEPQWVPAGELRKDHILLYPIVSKTIDVVNIKIADILKLDVDEKGYIKNNYETYTARRIPNIVPINRDFMRLIGYFLAEGSITPRGINFYFGPKDKEYVDDTIRIFKTFFDYDVAVKQEGSVWRIECYAGILRDLFQKLFGKYSYGKSLPHWFVYLPVDKQAELVKGYYRGDGGIKPEGFSLVTNSPKLVAQFKTILLRLGIIVGISRRSKDVLNKTKNVFNGREIKFKHDRYELEIGGSYLRLASDMFGVEHPHLKNKKRNNEFAWIKGNYAYLPIRRLETVDYDGEVHNIAVENNNTYVTAGAIVHNCDGAFFKNKEVIVIGGGDSAMEESLFLTKFASKITIIHRRDSFRASKIMQERVFKHEKIKVLWNKEIIDVLGNGKIVTGVKLKDIVTGKTTDFSCHGVFLAIGHVPNTSFLHGMLEMDELGYLKADAWTHTKVPGIFAAGDVQDRRFRQAITAAGSGCMAAMEAEKYLAGME